MESQKLAAAFFLCQLEHIFVIFSAAAEGMAGSGNFFDIIGMGVGPGPGDKKGGLNPVFFENIQN